MQASQLTAIHNAKTLLEQCGCFRGPPGPTGPQGPTGPAGKTLYYYSDGINTDPNAAGVDPCVYGLFIGSDGELWRSSPSLAIDSTFTATLLNGTVRTIAKQSDNKVIVGGDFTLYNGVSYNHIIRFNTDGSVDTTFSIGTGFNNTVRVITVQPDNKILIGGDFNLFNGSTYQYIIRLNSDGSVDSTFNSVPGFDNSVYSIVLASNNKIYVGGAFSFYDSNNCPSLARLTTAGFFDTTFNIGLGFDAPVYTIAVSSDDSVYVGGDFGGYNGIYFPTRIAHINSDGTYDSINFISGSGFNSSVYYIKLLSNSNILVVGGFTSYNGTSVNYVIELYANGISYNTFSSGFNSSARVAQVDLSNNYLIGGDFTSYNGNSNNYITRLNNTGSYLTDYPIITGFNNSVYSIYPETSNTFLVGGSFTSYDASTSQYLLRLKEKSCSWINTGTNILGNSSNTSTFVYALISTTNGLGTLGYVSTSQLTSTVRGLGTIGYISTSQLQSTIAGLGSLGYLSTAGSVTLNNLTSTVVGLGTAGYISSSQLQSTVNGLGTATSVTSSINGLANLGYISSTQLQSTVRGLGTIGYVSSSQLASTVVNLSRIGYISSSQLNSTLMGIPKYLAPNFISTVDGLGSAGYISSQQLISTVAGLGANSQTNLTSSLNGLGSLGYISSSQLISTTIGLIDSPELQSSIIGLGTLGYISSSQLTSTVTGIGTNVQPNLTSSLIGLGSLGYISSQQLISTVNGLGNIYLSSITPFNQLSSISTTQSSITSSLVGLGSLGYISSQQLISTVNGLGNIYLSSITPFNQLSTISTIQSSITSSLVGLGTLGYISSQQLISTVNGLGNIYLSSITPFNQLSTISTTQSSITSSLVGLGTLGYISSQQLISTVNGLGNIYISSFNLISSQSISTANLYFQNANGSSIAINNISSGTGFISSLNVNALTIGTGTGFVDFAAVRALLVSSIQVNTGILNASSIIGDGSQIFNLNAISSFNSISSLNISSGNIITSTFQASYVSTNQLIGTVITQSLNPFSAGAQLGFGSNTSQNGFYGEGHFRSTFTQVIQPTLDNDGFSNIVRINGIVSTQQIVTSTITANNIFARGTNSFVSTQQILAQTVTTLNINTYPGQDLVLGASMIPNNQTFRIGNLINSVNAYRLGSIYVFSTFTNVITGMGGVGQIGSTVSVTNTLSTQNQVVSSMTANDINTRNISSFFYGGIEKYNYISSIALNSTIEGLGNLGYISSTQLYSTTTGLVGHAELNSTIEGLGNLGYISSSQLYSTTTGLVDHAELNSSITGLGTLGYISSTQLYSTTTGLVDHAELNSTIEGLGTLGYVSSSQLTSTVTGIKALIIQTFTF